LPILILLLSLPGCGSNSEAELATNDNETTGNVTAVTPSNTGPSSDASALLQQVIQRYRRAGAYSDDGQVTLKYRANGRQFVDSAPYRIAFHRERKLLANVYQTTIDANDTRFRSRIASDDPELRQQFLDRDSPRGITWAALTEDPILRNSIERGLGRFPIVLELLLAPNPLSSFADQQQFPRRLLENRTIEGHDCCGLQVDTPDGSFVFWIDTSSYIVRRVQFPVLDIAAKMAAESGAENIQVTAELRRARFEWDADPSAEPLAPSDGDRVVDQFVLPPDPLPTDLLGRKIPPFALQSLAGNDIDSTQWHGRVVLLHWFIDHPACKASLQLFDKTARQYAGNQHVSFFAVSAASNEASSEQIHQLLRTWDVTTPVLRDSDAVGRDLFHIPALPAIMALGTDGRLQIYELTYIPRLDELLSEGVQQLLAGEDLAQQVLNRFDESQRNYQRLLENRGRLGE
jgi:thiol-disulfide isomerase/thioredoxin